MMFSTRGMLEARHEYYEGTSEECCKERFDVAINLNECFRVSYNPGSVFFHLSEVTEVYQANHQEIHEEVSLGVIFYVKILECKVGIEGDYWKSQEECSEDLEGMFDNAN